MSYKGTHRRVVAKITKTSGRTRAAAIALAAAAAGSGVMLAGGTANAATTITDSTYISNHPDSGNGGNWAYDDFTRTLTVTQADQSDCVGAAGFDASTDLCYTATVADNGRFNAIVGTDTPNQVTPGAKIQSAVEGKMTGNAGYTLFAPAADTLTGTVETSQNDNYADPANTDQTTSDWPAQGFATPADVTVNYDNSGNDWDWTYTDSWEKWDENGLTDDGNGASDGNITGASTFALTNPGDQTATVGTSVNLQLASTAETANGVAITTPRVTYTGATGLPSGLSLSASGLLTGSVSAAQAATPVTVTATGYGQTKTETFNLTVNAAVVTPPPTGPTYTATEVFQGAVKNTNSGKDLAVAGTGAYAQGTGLVQEAPGGTRETFQLVAVKNSSDAVVGEYLQAYDSVNKKWFYVVANGEGQLKLGTQVVHPDTASLTTVLGSAEVVKDGGGYISFTNDHGYVADVSGWSVANGGSVIAYPKNGGKNQQWIQP